MKDLKGIFALIVLIVLAGTGILTKIVDIFNWLIYINLNQPEISVFGDIMARVLTYLVSFAGVGLIFRFLNWYRSAPMKIVYFVVSTIVSFGLSWIVMQIEQHAIIFLLIIVAVIVIVIVIKIIKNKKESH